jgi:hypothetical protein
MSSADGPVLGITSSSASAMVIKCLQSFRAEGCCPSGVRSFQDGGRQKSLSTDGAHETSPPACGTSLDSSLLQHFQFYLWIKKKIYRSFSRSKEKRSRHFLILYENHTMSSSQEDELLSIVSYS